jgi:hypothetical protein
MAYRRMGQGITDFRFGEETIMKHRIDKRTRFIMIGGGKWKGWKCERCGVWVAEPRAGISDACDGVDGRRSRERIHRLLATKLGQVLPEVFGDKQA